METSDLLLSLIIIIIFVLLYLYNILGINIIKEKDLWSLYRCNPAYMSKARKYGYDPVDNFNNCVQNIQLSSMSEILLPVNSNINTLINAGSEINNSVTDTKKFINRFRNDISFIVKSIMNIILRLTQDIDMSNKNIIDILNQLNELITNENSALQANNNNKEQFQTLNKSKTNSQTKSKTNSQNNTLAPPLCFHPDTYIKTFDSQIVKIKDLKLTDRLKNGQRIYAIMNLNNLDNSNNYIEDLYLLQSGEEHEPIFVSGSHLIFDKSITDYIHVKNHPESVESSYNSDYLVCLITSDHTIPLGNYIFHDWEDNNGSPSKNTFL